MCYLDRTYHVLPTIRNLLFDFKSGSEYTLISPAQREPHFVAAETSFDGCRFAIGIRNANNKRFRLACTVGLRVFVCHNLAFRGDYTPVLPKHSRHFSLEDALSIGVDGMQRNFDPRRLQVLPLVLLFQESAVWIFAAVKLRDPSPGDSNRLLT